MAWGYCFVMVDSLVAKASANGTRSDWASAYCNVNDELNGVRLQPAYGSIPKELNGSLYRNGPGRLERDGHWVHHPFDGDGMVTALRFKEGSVELRNRFVRTDGWLKEEKAGKYLYRGLFGSQKPGGILATAFDVRFKNVANTNVVQLGDELLALWEAGSPYALDPVSLETRGLTLLQNALKPTEAFSAHPRFDPGHHGEARLVTFAVTAGPNSNVHLMEFATEGPMKGKLVAERCDSCVGFTFLHDFAITKNWAIFLKNPIALKPLPFVLGQKGAAQCLRPTPGGHGQFLLIPRECGAFAGEPPKRIDGPTGFVFHHLNAFEDPVSNEVVLDSINYNHPPDIGAESDFRNVDLKSFPEGQMRRCRINPTNGIVVVNWLEKRSCEFAMVNPHYEGIEARFAWMAVTESKTGPGPLQAIEKLDLRTGERLDWSAAPRGFVNEPVMVPAQSDHKYRLAEDAGWVLVLIWNAERCATDLVILRASDMQKQALIELPLAIPPGLHGSWVDNKVSMHP
jgi:all-trans-8'-apo-beta-carotenal 15,15'-oxygenase